jgi:hypothetical protein
LYICLIYYPKANFFNHQKSRFVILYNYLISESLEN